jgi:hypothetical protein
LGFLGVLGYRYYLYRDLADVLKLREPVLEQPDLPYLPLVILLGFFLGIFVNRVIGRTVGLANWFQDILAWLALVATFLLCAEVLIQLVINPNVAPENRIHPAAWHIVLSAIISFYFGARS